MSLYGLRIRVVANVFVLFRYVYCLFHRLPYKQNGYAVLIG